MENEMNGEESTNRAFQLLYDSLVRPDIDLGHDHPSSVRWEPPTGTKSSKG